MSRSSALPAADSRGRKGRFGWSSLSTPLVEIDHPDCPSETRILAKLESVQVGGSIKDRPVGRIVSRALERGDLAGGRRLLDSSSGNAGIAYSMVGARLGVPVTLVVPANASRERLERMRAHGAELVLTDPLLGYDEAIYTARRLAAESPDRFWYADQYSNADNWQAHYETTGQEVVEQVRQLGAPAEALVCGIGTGGTLTGLGRRLRRENPELRIGVVVPEIFPGIEGLKPLGHEGDLVPEILDLSLIEERSEVTMEEAVAACHWLARQGLLVGPSSGANLVASLRFAAGWRPATLVTVFSDTGERYGSTGLWT